MPRDRRRPDTGSRYHGTFLRTLAYLGNAARRGVPSVEMAPKVDRERLRSLVEPHWRRLYNFVFRLTLDRDRAERYVIDIYAQAAEQADQAPDTDVEVWLLGIGNKVLEERLPRQPEVD